MPKASMKIGDTKKTRPIRIKYKIGGRKSNVGAGSMTNEQLNAAIERGGKDKSKVRSYLRATGKAL